MNRFRDELIQLNRQNIDKQAVERLVSQKKTRSSVSGVIVDGENNCLVKFSRCCSPVPGDPIVGFITRGYGVSIHRQDCPNARQSMSKEGGRWVDANWSEDIRELYAAGLQVSGADRDGLLVDVATAINQLKIPMQTITARKLGDGRAVINLSADIRDVEQLEYVVHKLSRISGVTEVTRKEVV
jgi:GTP pyrophosphokinase